MCLVFSESARAIKRVALGFLKEPGVEAKAFPVKSIFRDWPVGLVGVPPNEFDIAVIMGGDGAVLKTLSALWPANPPFIGINFGRLGYLSEVEQNEWRAALEQLASGDFTVEPIMRIKAIIDSDESKPALNEIFLVRSQPYKLMSLSVMLEGAVDPVVSVKADGVIVSTPVGSTAHSLSAGGPIVDRTIRAYIINVINALYPTPKFVVAADKAATVTIECKWGATFEIVADGMLWKRVKCGTAVTVCDARNDALFIRLPWGRGARRVLKAPWYD